MSLRRKLLIVFMLLVTAGFCALAFWSRGEVRDAHAVIVEDALIDAAQMAAADIESQGLELFKVGVDNYKHRRFDAKYMGQVRHDSSLDFYVTDARGKVVYSSRAINEVGLDYSKWNDVYRTLRGQYGARATRLNVSDPLTSVYYVAAPIHREGAIDGVVTAIKTRTTVEAVLQRSIRHLGFGVIIAILSVGLFGAILVVLITAPVEALRRYALEVSEGRKSPLPHLPHRELAGLGAAFEKMRVSLEGKNSIERFVQSLTHELKSPLTAVRAGAELALEPMSDQQREKFLQNVIAESDRARDLLDRLLAVASLETKTELESPQPVHLADIVMQASDGLSSLAASRKIAVTARGDSVFEGDSFLLVQAVRNVLQNALEFSDDGASVEITITDNAVIVRDSGSGIPDFARARLFEKFYSLERPATGKKGTGLGLSFVREIMLLHNGRIEINSPLNGTQGTEVRLLFSRT